MKSTKSHPKMKCPKCLKKMVRKKRINYPFGEKSNPERINYFKCKNCGYKEEAVKK